MSNRFSEEDEDDDEESSGDDDSDIFVDAEEGPAPHRDLSLSQHTST